ncbi:MAG: DNA repair exonuclease [Candidatus Obscuribacterales bacterium]|nr:DNA repair exonuclease [Candidatus Obscuribacterales bacterium]
MRFIHTADWQLGMAFGHVQEKAEVLRQARMNAVKQIIALAESEKVDFVVAAGDLFDDNRISPYIVEEMAKVVSRSRVPVYLLPGNHDPLSPDSPYERCPNLFNNSAIVLRREEPIAVPGGYLYPCPARSRTSSNDPTTWIPARGADDSIRIGIAHGSVGTPNPTDFPIAPGAAKSRELDYLALGHWHGVKKIDERTYYSGAPEQTSFGETNAGKVLMVEIDAPGASPKIREHAVHKLFWSEEKRELNNEQDVSDLLSDIEELADENGLFRLCVRGALPQPQIDRIERIPEDWFFHFKLELDVAVTNGTWEYNHPLLNEMSAMLKEKTKSESDLDASVARLALSKLHFLVKHAGFNSEEP